MVNPLREVWKAVRGDHLSHKFTPLDATVNWSYVNHLVYTANTVELHVDARYWLQIVSADGSRRWRF